MPSLLNSAVAAKSAVAANSTVAAESPAAPLLFFVWARVRVRLALQLINVRTDLLYMHWDCIGIAAVQMYMHFVDTDLCYLWKRTRAQM